MVLRPIALLTPCENHTEADCQPVWDVILQTQLSPATDYWLIAQPDHAVLAGELAAHFSGEAIGCLGEESLDAIRMHDAGWAHFESQPILRPAVGPSGKVVSFLEVAVPDLLQAWRGSIQVAEARGPLAGLLVSQHFYRIGHDHHDSRTDSAADRSLLLDFLREEEERGAKLAPRTGLAEKEIAQLVDVLQFCDVVSLYLCSGSSVPVEFSQTFGSQKFRMSRQGDGYRFQPSPLAREARLQVAASRYPSVNGRQVCQNLAILVC